MRKKQQECIDKVRYFSFRFTLLLFFNQWTFDYICGPHRKIINRPWFRLSYLCCPLQDVTQLLSINQALKQSIINSINHSTQVAQVLIRVGSVSVLTGLITLLI